LPDNLDGTAIGLLSHEMNESREDVRQRWCETALTRKDFCEEIEVMARIKTCAVDDFSKKRSNEIAGGHMLN
jgi:hypothetical protein